MTRDDSAPDPQATRITLFLGRRSGVLLVECLAVLAIIAFVVVQLVADRNRIKSVISEESSRMQAVVADSTGQMLALLEQVLAALASDLARQGSATVPGRSSDLHTQLAASQRGLAFVESLFVLDAQGALLADSRAVLRPGDNQGSHPVFQEQVRTDRIGVFLVSAPPLAAGSITPALLYASIPWFDHTGVFGGVIAAVLSTEALSFSFERLRAHPDDVIGLARADGQLLVRNPYLIDVREGALLDAYRTAARSVEYVGSAYREEQGPFRIDRLVSYRKVRNFPVVAFVGLALEPRLQPWVSRAWMHAAWGFLALVLVLGSGQLWRYGLRARERENTARLTRMNGLVRASSELIACAGVADVMQTLVDLARELVPCRHARIDMDSGPGLLEQEFAVSGDRGLRGESPCDGQGPSISARLLDTRGKAIGAIVLRGPLSGRFVVHDHAVLNELAQVASLVIQKIQAEVVSRETGRELETVLNSMSDAVCHFDHDWKFTFANAHAVKLLAKPANALLGQCVWDVVPSVRHSFMQAQCQWAARNRKDVDFEFYSERLQGWFHFRAFPDAHGLTLYFQDITDHKARDEQLRQANRLEAMVRLAGSVAHDFNHVLGTIHHSAEQLTGCLEGQPVVRQKAFELLHAARQGIRLARPLLAFARRQPLTPQTIDPGRVLFENLARFKEALGHTAHLNISVVNLSEPWLIHVDVPLFFDVIQSVCLNARDAMGEGGEVVVRVTGTTLHAGDIASLDAIEPGEYVLITVSDSGVGMTQSELERVFDPFYTTKAAIGGSGLGLSMVHGFVRQSGGAIRIYSQPGEGTTVQIYLPRVPANYSAALQMPDQTA